MDDKKIKGKRRRRCASCGSLKYDVSTQVNPYLEDLYGTVIEEPYCTDCINAMVQDI